MRIFAAISFYFFCMATIPFVKALQNISLKRQGVVMPLNEPIAECTSTTDFWECCIQDNLEKFPLRACVSLKYLRKDIGISLKATVNNVTIIKEEISLRNPPPICEDVPYLENIASVCLSLHNITIEETQLDGCVNLSIKLTFFRILDYPLGCFHFKTSIFQDYISGRENIIEKLDSQINSKIKGDNIHIKLLDRKKVPLH